MQNLYGRILSDASQIKQVGGVAVVEVDDGILLDMLREIDAHGVTPKGVGYPC